MSLYAIDQKVWCRSLGTLATVTEANYAGHPHRRAQYLLALPGNGGAVDYLTGSSDLRSADWCCDGCGRWLAGYPHATAPDGEYPNGLGFCFLCVQGDGS